MELKKEGVTGEKVLNTSSFFQDAEFFLKNERLD
jgi:hypothetical protein